MDKNDVIKAIKSMAEDKNISERIVMQCLGMVGKMSTVPSVRPIIDDEIYGTGIAFDYGEDENGFAVEISVTDEGISGFTCYCDDEPGSFMFETDEDAVNFWNVIVGKLA